METTVDQDHEKQELNSRLNYLWYEIEFELWRKKTDKGIAF